MIFCRILLYNFISKSPVFFSIQPAESTLASDMSNVCVSKQSRPCCIKDEGNCHHSKSHSLLSVPVYLFHQFPKLFIKLNTLLQFKKVIITVFSPNSFLCYLLGPSEEHKALDSLTLAHLLTSFGLYRICVKCLSHLWPSKGQQITNPGLSD